jgi:predicted membrane protein
MEKITRYEKNIFEYEYDFNKFKKINTSELEKFQKELNQYKITTNLLFTDPNLYSDLKFIELDGSVEISKYLYEETIWICEHYNFIDKIRTIELDIMSLLLESNKIGLISNIQFRLAKKILNSIESIYKSDIILRDLYIDLDKNNDKKTKISNLLNQSNLDLFFNIIEIIILKMYNIDKKKLKKSNKIELLLENKDYLSNISKFKKLLEKSL